MKLITRIAALFVRRKTAARAKPKPAPRGYGIEITRIERPFPGGIPVFDAFPPKA